MDPLSITLSSILVLVGATVGVLGYMRNRDKDKQMQAEELAKLKADMENVKKEIKDLKREVDKNDDDVKAKLDKIDYKIDKFFDKVLELVSLKN